MQFFGGSAAVETSPLPAAPPGTASRNNANMLYIFNRGGICLLYREWHRPLRTLDTHQDQKLMFGLRSFTAKMDPTSIDKGNLGVPLLPGQGCSFYSFRTNTYKLNFMESPSGIKIILVTHPKTGNLPDSLKHIYNLYVEYVVKNPLYVPGTPIKYAYHRRWSDWDRLYEASITEALLMKDTEKPRTIYLCFGMGGWSSTSWLCIFCCFLSSSFASAISSQFVRVVLQRAPCTHI